MTYYSFNSYVCDKWLDMADSIFTHTQQQYVSESSPLFIASAAHRCQGNYSIAAHPFVRLYFCMFITHVWHA